MSALSKKEGSRTDVDEIFVFSSELTALTESVDQVRWLAGIHRGSRVHDKIN